MPDETRPSARAPGDDQKRRHRLRDRNRIMETVLDTIPNPVFYKDSAGCYLGCNLAFAEQIIGLPKEAIIGCSLFDLPQAIPAHLAEVYAAQDAALFASAGTQFYESEVHCADGIRRHFFFNKAVFQDSTGQPAGIVGVMLDITERKQFETSMRESERRLRFLSSKLLAAQEEERRRISMELHDDVGQNLAALKLQVQFMSKRLNHDQGDLKDECQAALGFIDRILESTRHLSRSLNPAVLEDLKLCGTIQWMLRDFQRYAAVATSAAIDDIDPLFSPDQQLIIYRLLQEVLHNVHKHAQARSVSLTVRRRRRHVEIQVCDDGRGFDVDQALNRCAAERGLGLAALEERSHMLGGRLEIHSEPGRGTRITTTIPFSPLETLP